MLDRKPTYLSQTLYKKVPRSVSSFSSLARQQQQQRKIYDFEYSWLHDGLAVTKRHSLPFAPLFRPSFFLQVFCLLTTATTTLAFSYRYDINGRGRGRASSYIHTCAACVWPASVGTCFRLWVFQWRWVGNIAFSVGVDNSRKWLLHVTGCLARLPAPFRTADSFLSARTCTSHS